MKFRSSGSSIYLYIYIYIYTYTSTCGLRLKAYPVQGVTVGNNNILRFHIAGGSLPKLVRYEMYTL